MKFSDIAYLATAGAVKNGMANLNPGSLFKNGSTKNIPGSHVIILSDGKEIPDSTIEQACILAAYHSKARESRLVPVDYTLVKYVKKPNGAKPGMVIFTNQQTAYVNPSAELEQKLRK